MDELGGLGVAINPKESPSAYSTAVHRNCLSAMEEAVAAGLVANGVTPPDGLAANVDAFRDVSDEIDELDAVLDAWVGFDPEDAGAGEFGAVIEDTETVIERVKDLVNRRTEEALTLVSQGTDALEAGEYETARDLLRESLGVLRRNHGDAEIPVLNCLGLAAEELGDYAQAHEYYRECIELAGETGREELLTRALVNLGELEFDRGEFNTAEQHLNEALDILRDRDDSSEVEDILDTLRRVALRRDDTETAVK
jgi:tetratricopeptide (TPR) repeat protein